MKHKQESSKPRRDKIARGNTGQFFVAGELCRRGYYAVVTLGNTPNTDILCSDRDGKKFVHIQVKTFVPGSKTCSVGKKAEISAGENFFWVLAGIPEQDTDAEFIYYIIPSNIMSHNVIQMHNRWLADPGKNGAQHNQNDVRTIHIPPAKYKHANGWSIAEYEGRWDLITAKMNG